MSEPRPANDHRILRSRYVISTGVLIFASEAEHYVEIIVDRGISKQVDANERQTIINTFTQSVKSGKTFDGFIDCITSCGTILQRVAPSTYEKNELPNHLIVLE